MFRKVLDIDLTSKYSRFKPKDKEFIIRLLSKIIVNCKIKNKRLIKWDVKDSSFKGVHIILFCSFDCDICRMCYDDDKHFAYDMNRPEYARNILFDRKEKIRI